MSKELILKTPSPSVAFLWDFCLQFCTSCKKKVVKQEKKKKQKQKQNEEIRANNLVETKIFLKRQNIYF